MTGSFLLSRSRPYRHHVSFSIKMLKNRIVAYQFVEPSLQSPPRAQLGLSSEPPMLVNRHALHVCKDTMFFSCNPAAPPPSMMSISPMGFSPKLYDQKAGQMAHPLAGMCAISATRREPGPKVSLDSRRTEARPWSEVECLVV